MENCQQRPTGIAVLTAVFAFETVRWHRYRCIKMAVISVAVGYICFAKRQPWLDFLQ
jgi:hypothetical protein